MNDADGSKRPHPADLCPAGYGEWPNDKFEWVEVSGKRQSICLDDSGGGVGSALADLE
jgi:hypothetical protein